MKILLDCDGVLADFVSAALLAHDRPETHDEWHYWDFYRRWCLTAEDFWRPMRGAAWWFGIKPYPWAADLLKALGDVTIVTAPNSDPECPRGKLDWLRAHFGITHKRVVIAERKEILAHPGTVLIDDYSLNVNNFRDHGGNSILFPQPWNCRSAEAGPDAWQTVVEEIAKLGWSQR